MISSGKAMKTSRQFPLNRPRWPAAENAAFRSARHLFPLRICSTMPRLTILTSDNLCRGCSCFWPENCGIRRSSAHRPVDCRRRDSIRLAKAISAAGRTDAISPRSFSGMTLSVGSVECCQGRDLHANTAVRHTSTAALQSSGMSVLPWQRRRVRHRR